MTCGAGMVFTALIQAIAAVIDIGENILTHTEAHFLSGDAFAWFRFVNAYARNADFSIITGIAAFAAVLGVGLQIDTGSPAHIFIGFFAFARDRGINT